MGTIFAILTARAALLVITLVSVSLTIVTIIAISHPPIDPFAAYADIMPGQLWQAILKHGFRCQFDMTPPSYKEEHCSLTPKTGTFSEINVSITYGSGRVSSVTFATRDKMLPLGNLILLWGQPEIESYAQMLYLHWPSNHIVAILSTNRSESFYWLPITSVAFESAD